MGLLSVEEALARTLDLSVPLEIETVGLEAGLGRALVDDVVASRTLPPSDNAAMDGYAVRAEDVPTRGTALRVSATIFAGARPDALEPGTCAAIATGASLPAGATAVVMQERVTRVDDVVTFDEVPSPFQHVRRRGEDVEAGAIVVLAHTPLGVTEAAALWAQGCSTVRVRRQPRVAIASSGDELCEVSDPFDGRIVDTNSPVLAELVRRAGGVPTLLGRAPDRLDAVQALLERATGSDVLVTVAGASVGEHDFTHQALAHLGAKAAFWKVAMKPGKPLWVGTLGRTLVFGLPGNPVSAMVTFEVFVRPALRRLVGLAPTAGTLSGRLDGELKKAPGLRHFVRARVERRGTEWWALPQSSQSSGAVAAAVGATHLISIGPDVTHCWSGSEVELIPLSWGP